MWDSDKVVQEAAGFIKAHLFKRKWAASLWSFGVVGMLSMEVPPKITYLVFASAGIINLGAWINSEFLKNLRPRWNSRKAKRLRYRAWQVGVSIIILAALAVAIYGTFSLNEKT
jgi:hypothetical protein